ncbi:uncharacterized protein LOC127122084 [Lathyrus oleraceus]|uniref:uncharacterized protein LOC127122084 n=1 Tax=Pisum sativum TaxID=3888 RepID=UPI0021CE4882|nr:uncharacterized protein LOC127122084 [Pisum sativum]
MNAYSCAHDAGSLAGEVGHDGKSRHSVARLCVAECGIDLQQFNITPGLLPKSLHTLNLSRNKISTIEGLRELTRMRVLDLSYNRISRIGQRVIKLYTGQRAISCGKQDK